MLSADFYDFNKSRNPVILNDLETRKILEDIKFPHIELTLRYGEVASGIVSAPPLPSGTGKSAGQYFLLGIYLKNGDKRIVEIRKPSSLDDIIGSLSVTVCDRAGRHLTKYELSNDTDGVHQKEGETEALLYRVLRERYFKELVGN